MKRALLSVATIAVVCSLACSKPSTSEAEAAAKAPDAQTGQPEAGQAAPAPPKPMPAQLPDVLARVNGEDITKAEFDRVVRNMELGNGPIPPERRDEILRGTLDRLITYAVLSQEAKARKVAVTDAEVDARVQEMRAPFPDDAAFQKALSDRNMTMEQMRSDARMQMAIERMMEAAVADVPAVTDEEAKAFYEKNPDTFTQAEMVRASHILVMVNENASDAEKQKARVRIDEALKRAKSGEDFAKLAQEYSQDGSAQQGGDLNYFSRGQMVAPFEEAAFALEPGQVSDVVTTPFGYHIIKVTDRKPATTVPLAEVNDRLKQFLADQKKQERAEAFITSLREKAKIEVLV